MVLKGFRKGIGARDLAGRLCPNAPTSTGARLDAIVGRGFLVITAVEPTSRQRDLIQRRHAVVYYAAPGTALAEWLREGKAHAAIVRPDFTVLGAGEDLSELCAALPPLGANEACSSGDRSE